MFSKDLLNLDAYRKNLVPIANEFEFLSDGIPWLYFTATLSEPEMQQPS